MQTPPSADADTLIKLVQLSLLFGRTNRATFHEDGKRPESDTDHTVMLGLVACGLAEKYYPQLDRGLVAQFALVHDLVEAYAGDTPTLKIDEEGRNDKAARELAALQRIQKEFNEGFPLLPELLTRYEERREPEARFVKAVDKIIPKATHILNSGATLRAQKLTRKDIEKTYDEQRAAMLEYAGDFPEILALRDEMVARMLQAVDLT
jgi:putative hydrolases of HD superfamily